MNGRWADFWRGGRLWIALSAASLILILAMMAMLGALIAMNGLEAIWPGDLVLVELSDGGRVLGAVAARETAPDGEERTQFRLANRDLYSGRDFVWIAEGAEAGRSRPAEALLLKRLENGDFFGFIADGSGGAAAPAAFAARLREFRTRWDLTVEPLRERQGEYAERLRRLDLDLLKADYQAAAARDAGERARLAEAAAVLRRGRENLRRDSEACLAELDSARLAFADDVVRLREAGGRELALPLSQVLGAVWPNQLSWSGKLEVLAGNLWALLSQYPREANTDGGIFPALFGTVMLVFLMAVSAFPLGVAAGVYLREYARDGFLSRLARVAVNNLAGVPSIVYGIFGLGFFVYGLGGALDRLLYPERVAAGLSAFGGGGMLWSSLTLGFLTLPVVVVATEEALSTVPSEIRQGSLALGATRFQTLWRVVLPMASPGILTGFILAMARAAGEVAPLMLTGVVKSMQSLPLDGNWPYLHLDRKFMHLGFHIYDMGFQSPNVEAAKPLVYLTALVLLLMVFFLNFSAIVIRNRMRERYALRGF